MGCIERESGRVGAVTRQRVLRVLFYVNILQCFFVVESFTVDPFSPKYRLSSIICDVASFRLFKPVRSEPLHENNRKFLHIPFTNKGIDAINISNVLNRNEVVKEIPPYFKNQSVSIVSYSYTNSIDRKMINYKEALQNINIEEYLRTLCLVTAPTLPLSLSIQPIWTCNHW
jgi:hypothetical protein